jgi:Cu/Ag efflux protein CusF
MRTKLMGLGLALAMGWGFSACARKVTAPTQSAEPKRYELKGKVVKLDKAQKRLEVAHEKIEGLMDAMTMPFAVKDDAAFDKLQVGDPITATLIYTNDNRYWLEAVKVTR